MVFIIALCFRRLWQPWFWSYRWRCDIKSSELSKEKFLFLYCSRDKKNLINFFFAILIRLQEIPPIMQNLLKECFAEEKILNKVGKFSNFDFILLVNGSLLKLTINCQQKFLSKSQRIGSKKIENWADFNYFHQLKRANDFYLT